MSFDVTYQGKVYELLEGTLYQFRNGLFAGTSGNWTFDDTTYANVVQVVLTGYKETSKRGAVGYQTTNGYYVILSEGWQLKGVVAVNQYSQTQAQALVNKIIKNNITIVQNNLVCARFANKFTEDERILIRDLQRRAEERKSALESQGILADIQTSYPAGFADLGKYLEALMNGESIGEISVLAIVIIAAVVMAGAGTAAYFAYKNFADQSEVDVKYSKELTKILQSKLTEAEYEQLKQETQGIVTKARLKQLVFGGSKALVIGGLVGLLTYLLIKNKRNERTN